jgi:acyl-lipid omega-6 desaturase (Delta-12 desaturase)
VAIRELDRSAADEVELGREELSVRSSMSTWRMRLAPYAQSQRVRSSVQFLTSVVAYLVLVALSYRSIAVTPLLTLALTPLAAGFLLRTFIVFHDCTHGSFWPSKRGNECVGRLCGLLTLSAFARWRHDHAVHHATAGDLDRRGTGDIPILAVAEYNARSRRRQRAYRMARNPVVMFGVGAVFVMMIGPRIWSSTQRPRLRHSVMLTDIALLLAGGTLMLLLGPVDAVLAWLPAVLIASSAGVFLFYVQHQYEDVYWERHAEWSFAAAALQGSSYLKLPRVLQFFTGNIGLHHVHHMSSQIPNYNLQRAHDEVPAFHSAPVLLLRDAVKLTRLKLWDEDAGRMVSFREARASGSPPRAVAPTSPT